MNKRERFIKFLNNEPVDRVPVAFFHHFCANEDFNKGLVDEKYFEQNVEGHRISKANFNPDVAKIMSDSLIVVEMDTSFVEKPEDLLKVRVPDLDSKYMQKMLELTKRARAIYDEDTPVLFTSFSPVLCLRNSLAIGGMAWSREVEGKFLGFLAEAPEIIGEAVGNISKGIMAMNEMLLTEGGCDGMYISYSNQSNLINPDIYRTHVSPHEKAVLEAANKISDMNILHICGYAGATNDLKLYQDYEAGAINWAVHGEGVSLSEGKKFFGGKPVFGGFKQAGVLYTGTREEVEAEVFHILDDAGQVGVMLGADCTVPGDINEERFEWVREATAKYAAK